jgi:hypothetical protein
MNARLLILSIILLPTLVRAQDLNGLWKGTMVHDTSGKTFPYELMITEKNGKISGYSYTVFNVNDTLFHHVKKIKGRISDIEILIEDAGSVSNNFDVAAPTNKSIRQQNDLRYRSNDTAFILTGVWRTTGISKFAGQTGKLVLIRLKQTRRSDLLAKLEDLKIVKADYRVTYDQPESLASNAAPASQTLTPPAIPEPAPIELEPRVADSKPARLPASVRVGVMADQLRYKNQRWVVKSVPPPPYTPKPEPVVAVVQPEPKKEAVRPAPPVVAAPKPEPKQADAKPADTKPAAEVVKKDPSPVVKTPPPPVVVAAPKPEPKQADVKSADTKPAAEVVKKDPPPVVKTPPPPVVSNAPAPAQQALIARAATAVEKRAVQTIQTVNYVSDSLTIELYDNGEVDGDTVSILLNRQVILPMQGLKAQAVRKTIYTAALGDSVELMMYAENLGAIPPNTGLLILKDGSQRYEIRFSADMQKNAAVVLRRRK